MNLRNRITKEIEIQKSIEGDKCQDELLLKVLNILKTESQWRELVKCEHYRYGTLSYQTHRFYYPKEELLELLKLTK